MKNSIIFSFILTSIIIVGGCSKKQTGPPPQQAVPVVVAPVTLKDVPVEIQNIGNVEAYSTVSVLSQVGGELTNVFVKEGQDVKKGDVLFKIDTRPYETEISRLEAQLNKDRALRNLAIANLAKDSAQLVNSQADVDRYEKLLQGGVVTKQDYDNIHTNQESFKATVDAELANIKSTEETEQVDKASIENAKINLGYCTIRSPIDGRTGSLLLNQGNIIKAADKPLIIINKVSPIYVTFTLPEVQLADIKKYQAIHKLNVEATLPNNPGVPSVGVLTFIDNQVDQNSGTIRLKAEFENKDHKLWPGQYVNVKIRLTTQTNVLVIPTEAVQNGQQGKFVYVVKDDKSVEQRMITVSLTREHDVIVDKGLTSGESVVTEGQLRLIPGVKVNIVTSSDSTKNATSAPVKG